MSAYLRYNITTNLRKPSLGMLQNGSCCLVSDIMKIIYLTTTGEITNYNDASFITLLIHYKPELYSEREREREREGGRERLNRW